MSKKRGLSVDEKRSRMLDYFYNKKDFFLLKELEKSLPKEKGITPQTVKEILQSLVDDDLVDTDKIGTSCYFWAFPSKATQNRKRKLKDVQEKLSDTRKKMKSVEIQVEKSSWDKIDGEERRNILQELAELEKKKSQLENQIALYKDSDPETVEMLKNQIKISKESANRWTDNIYSIHSWIGRKFPSISVTDLNKQFGIPQDLDYVE